MLIVKTKKNSTLSISVNITLISTKVCMNKRTFISNITYIISKTCKDMNYIIVFNFDKKNHYVNTYNKTKKDHNTLQNL